MLSEETTAADNPTRFSEQASSRRELEMQEWARALRIPPARLKEAVSVVGITPRKIREYLRRSR